MSGGGVPSGTVTFLFTDVEGSTRLWSERGAEMRDAMALHDRLLREAIEGRSGYVFTTAGDSFAAAFGRAADALGAAVDLRRSVTDAEWPPGLAVRVRVGLHTGEADERDGDFFGSAVNRAARLMSAAHGGQIVVSGATRDVLVDTPLGEVDLVAIGEHSLKDFDEPVTVFEVLESGQNSPFLRLRNEQSTAGNLPPLRETLVGRDADVAAILGLLGGRSVVTIVGVGGIGKTRLALACAADRSAQYEHGAWWCELAPVGEPEAVAQAVAQTIGAKQHAGLSMVDSVAEYCRRRRMLLVLDNCEHVLDAAGDVIEALLDVAPGVDVIATSREASAVEGERIYPLAPLSSVGVDAPAVELFVRRATAVAPDLSWDAERSETAERICARLDGLPLAIELAATRVRSLSLAEIEQQLDQAFRVLRGGRRSVERHRTLEAAIDWSYEALTEHHRALFDRLSVFAGGFDLPAATAVGADEDLVERYEVIDLLDDLVAKSLIDAERIGGAVRYRMLEPLRQFAEDRLAASGDAEGVRHRHLDYCVEWAELWRDELPASGLSWRHRLERELANLRTAVSWAVSTQETAKAARLVVALAFAQQSLLLIEIGDWADEVQTLPDIGQIPQGPAVASTAAMTCWWRADVQGFLAQAAVGTEMPAVRLLPDDPDVRRGLATFRGLSTLVTDGDSRASAAAFADVDRAQPVSDAVTAWLVLTAISGVDPEVGSDHEWEENITLREFATLERLVRQTGSPIVVAMLEHRRGIAALHAGDFEAARGAARRGLTAAFEVGADFYAHHNVSVLAQSLAWLDDFTAEDLATIVGALREQRDIGLIADQWLLLSGSAGIVLRHGDVELARDIYRGLLLSQWERSPATTRLGGLLGVDGVAQASDDNVPDLDDLVDRALAALDALIPAAH